MNRKIDISDVVLTTERLTLRLWSASDLMDLYEYASVDGVGQMAGWKPHKDLAESKGILQRFIEGKKVFALERQGKVIGSLGVEEYNEEHHPELSALQGREIGYVLSKAYWGQGLMPEAVKAVIGYLFESAELDFLICGHFDWNSRSQRVIEKCGFRYRKTVPFETAMGNVENAMDYILYREEWHAMLSRGACGTIMETF